MLQVQTLPGLSIDVRELVVCPPVTATVEPGAQQFKTVNTTNEFPSDRSFLMLLPGELADWGALVSPWLSNGVGAYFGSPSQVVFDWFTSYRPGYTAPVIDGALVVAVRLKTKPRLIEHVVLGSTPPITLANQFDPAQTWLFPCGMSQTTNYRGFYTRLLSPNQIKVFKGDGVTEVTSLNALEAKQRLFLVQP